MRTNAPKKAINVIKNHLLNHPNNIACRNIYAEYLFNTDREKSIAEYEKLLAIDKKSGIALNNLAWIYYEKQEYIKAKGYINKATEYYPNNINISDTAAKISSALKNK